MSPEIQEWSHESRSRINNLYLLTRPIPFHGRIKESQPRSWIKKGRFAAQRGSKERGVRIGRGHDGRNMTRLTLKPCHKLSPWNE